ncbi:UNVERIFIED_CONTAM: hypothetical protein Sangu_2146900 [Sesamum angustifolium]|uniref:G-patch domain-containing protein n=1 Tax=Sesamum angustifolium TaxID=2727405 RepID=A0AAW2LE63_9LAMI
MSMATKIHVTPHMGIILQSNEDTLFGKEDSSDTDDCMSTFTDEDLLLGSKPHNRPCSLLDISSIYMASNVLKYCRNGIVKKINMKQPSKPPLKGFVPSTQEEKGGHEALAIDDKGFNPKAFKLLIKAGYDPKEKLNLGKLPPEATGKKLDGLNATQIMLKGKGHVIQDSRVGLGFTLPKPVRITIKRVNSNYISEGFSSTKDHKREENLRESVFNI